MPLRCLGGHTQRVPGLRMLSRCGFVCPEEHFEGLDGQGDLRGLFVLLEECCKPMIDDNCWVDRVQNVKRAWQ